MMKPMIIWMTLSSPSTRRAWIEIPGWQHCRLQNAVALHPEGVDRNSKPCKPTRTNDQRSPSTRRAWIEIQLAAAPTSYSRSPSTRRAWIEIWMMLLTWLSILLSPSTRRAWIEMFAALVISGHVGHVALHPEGVDRNMVSRVI